MPIFIHASRSFAKRYDCDLSLPGERIEQAGSLDAWSAHHVRIGRKPIVMMMNDASLWSIIVPATGMNSLAKFLPVFLDRVAETWAAFGASFDAACQNVVFLPRTNRSLISSMNDVIQRIRFEEEDAREEGRPMDWREMEDHLNEMPYGAMSYDSPDLRLPRLLGEGG